LFIKKNSAEKAKIILIMRSNAGLLFLAITKLPEINILIYLQQFFKIQLKCWG